MKIAVGTTNPNKVEAVSQIVEKVWSGSEVIPIKVSSQVKNQPDNDKITILGATNRARNALNETNADIGIGIEGGVVSINDDLFVTNWAVVIDKNGNLGIGCGPKFVLPKSIAKKLSLGVELGDAMNEFTGRKNVKHTNGAIGTFTNDLVTRKDNNQIAVMCALARIINKELYE
jgi:inosine/xanthosine triphosphatase